MIVIVNLSTEAQSFQTSVKLPGVIHRADIWIQSEYKMDEGFTTDVNITNHSNLNEYFDCFFNFQ